MPLIRYRMGDCANLTTAQTPCKCGRSLPTIQSIEGRTDDVFFTRDGREMTVIQPKLVILDQSLKDTIAQYPYTWVNGVVMARRTNNGDIKQPSYLIQVPHNGIDNTVDVDDAHNDGAAPSQPAQDSDPIGISGLRSIGQ